jgi:hypothetical protein
MKKVFMLAALVLGTTAMVNAQTTPAAKDAKAAPAKEVKATKKMTKKTTTKKVEATTTAAPAKK